MTKEEIEIFNDIATSLSTIAAALSYDPRTDVLSVTESLALIEKRLESMTEQIENIYDELDDIASELAEDE